MSDVRLEAALAEGLLPSPDDTPPLIFGAPPDGALARLYPHAQFIQPLQPDNDAMSAAGRAVFPALVSDGPVFGAAIIMVPRARALAHDWIAQAAGRLAPGGLLILDGAKTDGIDSLWRALRPRLCDPETLTKAHGRLFCGRVTQDRFGDLRAAPKTLAGGFCTAPGVFSADGVDPGSAALADALPARLAGHIVDLGAGWGWLSAQILKRNDVAHLDLVEADHAALDAARENVTDPRAAFHWADATRWRPSAACNVVVMNPPFHAGRAGDPGLGQAFIGTAAASLGPNGQLWLVANRHLPYEATLDHHFRDWQDLGGTSAFKILQASRPRQTRKGARP